MIRHVDRGADAEEDNASLLSELSNNIIVLDDIESPHGNNDHIIISQKIGVPLLETKSHRGTGNAIENQILVNGQAPEKLRGLEPRLATGYVTKRSACSRSSPGSRPWSYSPKYL